MPKIEKRTYIVTGTKKDLDVLEEIFKHMEYLGAVGADRKLTIRVDGSGFSKIRVRNENGERLDESNIVVDSEVDVEPYSATSGYYEIG